ncbi:MAG: hypothetical protein QOD77_210 [Thermoplasmata archaeon]|jgi:uncharacterized membrane protein|nr:hypothetical protein [Thermoplasmata archaeon]
MRPRAILATLAVLLVLHSAAAQVPPIPPLPPPPGGSASAGVEVRMDRAQVTVSLDESAVVELTVTNTGTPTGTPLDQPRTVVLDVVGETNGWTASIDPTTLVLNPGQSLKARVTVGVSAQAQATVADLNVTARMYPAGVGVVPGVGPAVDPEATDTAPLRATRDDSAVRNLLEQTGPYLWVVLLGLLAAVVVLSSVLAANRRVAVRIASPAAHLDIAPGGRVALPVTVSNITKREDTVVLRAVCKAEGWATFLPTPQVDLDGGQEEELSVIVIAPKDARPEERAMVEVVAVSAQAPRRPAKLQFEATVAAGAKRRATGSTASSE